MIVDFEVVTTNTNLADIKSVESGLIAALAPDFIVQNGSFKITYKSKMMIIHLFVVLTLLHVYIFSK